MTCKDCIHFDVCKDATVPNPEYKGVQPDKSKECRRFKNKSDYAEVKHGGWKEIRNAYGELEGWLCECGRESKIKENYCPNCGAKMDGRRDT